MQKVLPHTTLSEAQMMAELRIVFPTLWMRPLREFSPQYAYSEGIWTGSDDGAEMPDGTPIFDTCCADPDEYDGTVHQGFIAWLGRRGWCYDRYDGATYFLVPNSYFDESMGPWPREWYEEEARALADRTHVPSQPGELPF